MTTLEDLQAVEGEVLTVEQVASVIGCGQQLLRVSANQGVGKLPPHFIVGSRVLFPKRAFIHWFTYGDAPIVEMVQSETA